MSLLIFLLPYMATSIVSYIYIACSVNIAIIARFAKLILTPPSHLTVTCFHHYTSYFFFETFRQHVPSYHMLVLVGHLILRAQ